MGEPVASIAALEELYRRRYRRFLRVSRALVGDADRASDAVQEAFARAIRARFDYRGEGSLEAWLWRTLLNVCADEGRATVPPTAVEGAAVSNGAVDEWPELRAAVAALPERQRLILFLRHYADLDYETIASAVGIRRGTVAAALHAAHRTLREALTEVRR
jgi:RNA polymerase sigma-70 factor (ECF subfamily)